MGGPTDMQEAQLYGGAMLCELPRSFADASTLREVPDHQEVWVDTGSDRSLMIEILERKDVADEEAMHFFLSDLAAFNDASEASILRSGPLAPEEVPHVPGACAAKAVGEQIVAKFREDRRNRVQIHAAVLRLPQVSTDVLITLNDPVSIDPESSSADAPVPVESAEAILAAVLRSFRIADWGLFG
ncbi:unnamed protein product [Effrenium voratum]|nr:unnamed protein product [Effrenium voratum]